MKTGAIISAVFYIVPYYVRERVITIFLELERCYFSPQVWELCMATRQNCIPLSILPIQNKYSKYLALMLMFENSFYMYFVDSEPFLHI